MFEKLIYFIFDYSLPLSADNEVLKSQADKDYENAKVVLLGPLGKKTRKHATKNK